MSVILHEERDACGLKLIVTADPDPTDPRRDHDHLCTMVCWHRRYELGDKHDWSTPEEFRAATSEQPQIRLPVYLYDHVRLVLRCAGRLMFGMRNEERRLA